jgi:isopentenyldiphosphate isomerase
MEFFDVVDEAGRPTGEVVSREVAHRDGIRHRTAHMWVTRQVGGRTQVLLQKRAACKDSFPGCYDTSSAGHVRAGDEPRASAIRELGEELGIRADPSDLRFLGTFHIKFSKEFHGTTFRDNEVSFVYLYARPVDAANLTLQAEEVERVDWFDLSAVRDACLRNDPRFCVSAGDLELLSGALSAEA